MLEATSEFSRVSNWDAIMLCIPTPLDDRFEPNLSFVTGTLESVVPHLRIGQVISLESTTYPGTTEEEVVSHTEGAGFTIGKDLFVVYSPERENPGNPKFSVTNMPKVVGGHTPEYLAAGVALYQSAFDQVLPVSSTKVAELSKLLENIYRAVNIGLVNKLKIAADRMGIDIWEVISAASTKSFGFTAFYPGPGLGGHCIPIDPFYLTWKARGFGVHTRFVELAGEINRTLPDYVVQRTMESLNSHGKPFKGSRILLLGIACKPDVNDMRESHTFALMDMFAAFGAKVAYLDPHVPVVGPTRAHMNWAGHHSLDWSAKNLSSQDVIVIATHYATFDLHDLAQHATLIVDTRNAMNGIPTKPGQLAKA